MRGPPGRVHPSGVTSTSTSSPAVPVTGRAARLTAAGLSLLAAAAFGVRAVLTALDDDLPADSSTGAGVALASLAAALSVGAAGALAARSLRLAAIPLAAALALELVVLGRYVAPPRLVTAIPLVFALAVCLGWPGRPSGAGRPAAPRSWGRTAAAGGALALMVPIGFMYLTTGLVAPAPDVFGVYVLFAVLVVVAVRLARRHSWWVLAVPVASAALWFLVLLAGAQLRGWSP